MSSLLTLTVTCTFWLLLLSSLIIPGVQLAKSKLPQPDSLKPSLYFTELQLRPLCETEEWITQFKAVRSRWTKCLGFQKVFLPPEVPTLKRATLRLLEKFANVADEQLNPFCRLSKNWRVCSHYLRKVPCLVADYDVIQRAKNPKYTPLGKTRKSSGPYGYTPTVPSRYAKDDDDIDHQAELYSIQCEAVRLSAHYRSQPEMINMMDDFGGGVGGFEGEDGPVYEAIEMDDGFLDDFEDEEEREAKLKRKAKKKEEL